MESHCNASLKYSENFSMSVKVGTSWPNHVNSYINLRISVCNFFFLAVVSLSNKFYFNLKHGRPHKASPFFSVVPCVPDPIDWNANLVQIVWPRPHLSFVSHTLHALDPHQSLVIACIRKFPTIHFGRHVCLKMDFNFFNLKFEVNLVEKNNLDSFIYYFPFPFPGW